MDDGAGGRRLHAHYLELEPWEHLERPFHELNGAIIDDISQRYDSMTQDRRNAPLDPHNAIEAVVLAGSEGFNSILYAWNTLHLSIVDEPFVMTNLEFSPQEIAQNIMRKRVNLYHELRNKLVDWRRARRQGLLTARMEAVDKACFRHMRSETFKPVRKLLKPTQDVVSGLRARRRAVWCNAISMSISAHLHLGAIIGVKWLILWWLSSPNDPKSDSVVVWAVGTSGMILWCFLLLWVGYVHPLQKVLSFEKFLFTLTRYKKNLEALDAELKAGAKLDHAAKCFSYGATLYEQWDHLVWVSSQGLRPKDFLGLIKHRG
ncbi:hypothetical protein B0T24DRAFT_710227 [Lasiosphaeria ovina]|uniref:Uncharacterized protein n=1 Tax=Lasiosphaeria ovina TaxID=92902 RepID=A0AAE0JZT0_9PEZI|nr:hypothetical protein B0T24DRAFT_710227 [Lasiosphaeria ovina]